MNNSDYDVARGDCSAHAAGNASTQEHDRTVGKKYTLSLYEAVTICMPTASIHMRKMIVLQMAGRWRHLIAQHPTLPRREIRNHRDELMSLTALHDDIALHHVNLWLPWAVNRLREEVEELVQALDIRPETVRNGANAPEEPGDDELLL